MLDLTLGITILSFALRSIRPSLFVGDGIKVTSVALALVPVSLIFEAGAIAIFGTTLGKGISGLSIRATGHERPPFSVTLERNIRIWFFGLSLGLPIIALGTLINNYRKVAGGEQTSWDESCATRVFALDSSVARTSAAAVMYIALVVLIVAFPALGESARARLSASMPGMNRGLPRMIDRETTLSHIELDASTIVYDYTLTNNDGSNMSAESAKAVAVTFGPKEAAIRSNLCANKNSNLIGRGIGMRYVYAAQGAIVIGYTVSPEDCR